MVASFANRQTIGPAVRAHSYTLLHASPAAFVPKKTPLHALRSAL
jgi:hypothetical protein